MNCREIRAWLATRRDLSLAQEREAQAHLAHCSECASVWRREERAMHALRGLPVPDTHPPDRVAVALRERLGRQARQRYRRKLALVGAALCVLLAGVLVPRDVFRRGNGQLTTAGPAGRPDRATPGPAGVVTIGFAAAEHERQVYEPLIEAFNAQNPDLRVQFVSFDDVNKGADGGRIDRDLLRAIARAADTAAPFAVYREDIANGTVRDLTPFIDADPTFARDDFYPAALEASQMNGVTFVLPHTFYVPLLFYNKDLFAARGLPLPRPGWSWDELVRSAEQLARKRGDKVEVYGLMELGSPYNTLAGTLAAGGLNLFTAPVAQVRLDRPEVVAAVERVAAMVKSGAIYVNPNQGGHDPNSYEGLIGGDRVGMWQVGMLRPNPIPSKSGTVPYPALPLPFVSGTVEGYIMSGGTQHPQEAWRWLSFLSHQELKGRFGDLDSVSRMPVRTSLAGRSGYWSKLDAETTAAVKAVIERPMAPPLSDVFQVSGPLNRALDAVIDGKQSAAEAVQEAQAALQRQAAQSPRPPTGERIVVAPPTPQARPEGATTITYFNQMGRLDEIRRIARKFNQEHPEIIVKLKDSDNAGGPITVAEIAATYDCFPLFVPPTEDEMAALLDLQPLIDADPSINLADYPPALLAPYRRGSSLHGIPYAVALRYLAYNQDAFDQAGLSYPTAAWTLDDFVKAARQLAGGTGDDRRYGFTGPHPMDLFFFLDRMGASTTSGSSRATVQPNFTDPAVVEAIRVYLDLLRTGSPHKRLQGYARDEGANQEPELFAEGRVGMMFGIGMSSHGQRDGTIAIAPPPFGTSRPTAHDFSPLGLHISATTQHPEACWTWLTYLSQQMSALPDGFPGRISMAESAAWTGTARQGATEVYQAYREAWEHNTDTATAPESFYQSPIDYYWFFRAVDRAFQGGDLNDQLAIAQNLTAQFLACTRSGAQASACATQVDPDYRGWKHAAAPGR